jgi:hypothetical protein
MVSAQLSLDADTNRGSSRAREHSEALGGELTVAATTVSRRAQLVDSSFELLG